MPKKRICPKCNSVLGSFDHYFCSTCGNSLEGDVVQPVTFTRTTYFTVPSNSRTEFLNKAVEVVRGKVEVLLSSKNLVMGLSALLLLVLAVGVIYYLVNQSNKEAVPSANPQNKSEFTINLNIPAKSGLFGSDTIAENVPDDVELYIEGFDYDWISSLYLEDGRFKEEFLGIFSRLFSDHYALFAVREKGRWTWTAVFIPRDMGTITRELEEVSVPGAQFKLIGDRFIVSTEEELFEDVEEARSKTDLNLPLTPEYVSSKAKLEKEGKILIIFFNDESKEVLKSKTAEISSAKLSDLVEQILKSGYNELVIK